MKLGIHGPRAAALIERATGVSVADLRESI